ncbi:cell surface protein [Secundilactobacillus silagincola]|uniref:Cell surface protein n=1 Tax=Secundilactobacillus silagincola TaxID=1714681 RepID=A0A1Z5J0W8_9LACO|nr:LPXTG cell wall anchor domain-containing protein [Secundilactobacillus silagincola]GAX07687.1 cell surface protein [Secundilactobacillus silagincola]
MKKNWFKKLFGGIFLVVVTLVSVSAAGQVRANALADGTYTVPVSSINKDTGGTSASQAYLGNTGNVTVSNGIYTVSVPISGSGQNVLKSASMSGSSILSGGNLIFKLSGETPQVQVDYHIVVAVPGIAKPLIDMSPSAYERFDWENAKSTGTSEQSDQSSSQVPASSTNLQDKTDNGTDANVLPQVTTISHTDTSGKVIGTTITIASSDQAAVNFAVANGKIPEFKPQDDGSGYDIYVDGVKVDSVDNGTTPTTTEVKDPQGRITGYQIIINGTVVATVPDGAQGSSSNSGNSSNPSTPLADVSKLSYTVLQSDGSSVSEANKYYTHAASIEKLSNGSYKVTMHVQYGKNSGMSAKGFVPLTVDGKKVSDVTYGSTDKDYTASFSFTVPNLDALTKAPVKGTIHVSVPTMDISSDFDIYYLFTGATASDGTGTTNANSSVAAETPSNSSQTPVKAVTATSKKASSKLPQTSEIPNATIAVVGFVSLIMIVITAIYRRKRV